MELKISVPQTGVALVVVTGEVAVHTHQQLKTVLLDLIEDGHHCIAVNLAGVRYIDSMGLGVLIGALKKLREHGGRIVLVGVTPPVRKSFLITGLVRLFEMYDDDAAALARFGDVAA